MNVSLKKYFKSKIKGLNKATSLATKNLETRLEGMNEFRSQLTQQAANFATKESVDEKFQTRDAKIESVQRLIYIGVGIMIAVEIIIGIIFGVIVAIFIR